MDDIVLRTAWCRARTDLISSCDKETVLEFQTEVIVDAMWEILQHHLDNLKDYRPLSQGD